MAMSIFSGRILSGKPISVYNNGNMKRDFTYIDDIINGTLAAMEKNYNCEIFNLGNRKSENIMDMISLIEKELNTKAIIDFQPMQPGDAYETCADIDYSKEKIDYNPSISIEEGIPLFIKWYKEYYKIK